MSNHKIIAVIPARYDSVRFPAKMLALVKGKPLIAHVYERVVSTNLFDGVWVAYDDERIGTQLAHFEIPSIPTSPTHISGTDRIIEATSKLDIDFSYVVNVQGDEALIALHHLEPIVKMIYSEAPDLLSIMKRNTSKEDFQNQNCVKVVVDANQNALYFSRTPIPYQHIDSEVSFYQHGGIYAFSKRIIPKIKRLPKDSFLESTERLEQLRWLENQIAIKMVEVKGMLKGVDVPQDLEDIHDLLSTMD